MKFRTPGHAKSSPSKTRKTRPGALVGIALGVGLCLGWGGLTHAAEGPPPAAAATARQAAAAMATAARRPVEGYPWSSVVAETATVPAALVAILERI